MPSYTIYSLGESQISISGGAELSGYDQGDGSHLVGETITLYSDLPDFEVDMLAPALEAQVQRFLATLEISEEERQHVLRYDIPIFLMPASTALARFIESGFVDRFVLSDKAKEDYLSVTNFSATSPSLTI